MTNQPAVFLILLVLTMCGISVAQTPTADENENRIRSKVVFVGLAGKSAEGLLDESLAYKVVSESGLKISENNDYNGVEKAAANLKEWLATKGYPDAAVETLSNDGKALTFVINTGAKVRVAEVRFTGNKAFSDAELLATLKNCYKDFWETYDENFYDYCLNSKTRSLALSKGYLKAEIGKPNVERSAAGFILTIPVSEGKRFRLGNISIEGAKTFTAAQLLQMFGQKSGDILDGKALRDFLYERLGELYKNKGYLQYEAEVEPEYFDSTNNAEDGVVNLKIVVTEGRRSNLHEFN